MKKAAEASFSSNKYDFGADGFLLVLIKIYIFWREVAGKTHWTQKSFVTSKVIRAVPA